MKNKCHMGRKTLWEKKKEKLLVTSNFFFSHNVLHNYVSLVCQNVVLCGNGLREELSTILSSNLKMSATSLSLEQSQICCLGKGCIPKC